MRCSAWRLLGCAVVGGLIAMTWARSATAESPLQPDLSYAGAAETGGRIVVTLTPDRSAVLAFVFDDTPLPRGNCGTSRWQVRGYYDPPVPVESGQFTLAMPDLGSVHNALGFTIAGSIDPFGTELTGTMAVGGSIPCQPGVEVPWSARGPVETAPGPDDVTYEFLGGSETVKLSLTHDLTSFTSLELRDVSFLPCIALDSQVDARTTYDPPIVIGSRTEGSLGDTFIRVFTVGRGSHGIAVDVQKVEPEEVTLHLFAVGFLGACTADRTWILTRAASITPEPTATAALQLPSTGSRAAVEGRPATIFVALAALGLVAGGSLAAAWWRRRT